MRFSVPNAINRVQIERTVKKRRESAEKITPGGIGKKSRIDFNPNPVKFPYELRRPTPGRCDFWREWANLPGIQKIDENSNQKEKTKRKNYQTIDKWKRGRNGFGSHDDMKRKENQIIKASMNMKNQSESNRIEENKYKTIGREFHFIQILPRAF